MRELPIRPQKARWRRGSRGKAGMVRSSEDLMLSVIVSTYNRAEFLGDALDSLLRQDFPGRTQVIVCDDGSQDSTPEVLERFGAEFEAKGDIFHLIEEHPTLEQRRTEVRYVKLINRALPLCAGRYVSYLPDDDLYLPARNKTMVRFLDENPDVFLAYHFAKIYAVDGAKQVQGLCMDLCDSWDEANAFWVRNVWNRIDHSTLVHRNLFGDNILWDEDMRFLRCGDWGFLLRVMERGHRIASVPEYLSIGRKIVGASINLNGADAVEAAVTKSWARNTCRAGIKERIDPLDADAAEIDKYEHIARYEWARDHLMNDWCVGDIACGTGYGSAILLERCRQVIGIDYSDTALRRARARTRGLAARFLKLDLDRAEDIGSHDAVVSLETVEHLEDPHRFVRLLKSAARRRIIISAPVRPQKHLNPWHKHDFTRKEFEELCMDDAWKITATLNQRGEYLTLCLDRKDGGTG